MLLNRPRANESMDECKLDALVATSWVNVLYLTDYYLWIQPQFRQYMFRPGANSAPLPIFAILPREEEPALVLDQGCELNAAGLWVQDRYVYGEPDGRHPSSPAATAAAAGAGPSFCRTDKRYPQAIDALVAALSDRHLNASRIGIELEGQPPEQLAVLSTSLPRAELRDASNLFRLVRMVKSEEEQRLLVACAEINEQAALAALETVRSGVRLQDIVQAFRVGVAERGAAYDHFAFSQGGIGVATEIDAQLPTGESLFIDFGCVHQHYYSDAGTTLFVGPGRNHDATVFAAIVESLSAGAALLRPGTTASQVQAAMGRALAERGIFGQFPHGHGMGLEVREYPILVPDTGLRLHDDCVDLLADIALEAGTVVNLEVPLFDVDGSAFQLEQSFLVSESGGAPLSNRDLTRALHCP